MYTNSNKEEERDNDSSINYNDHNRTVQAIRKSKNCDRTVHTTSIDSKTKRTLKTGESSMISNDDDNGNKKCIDYYVLILLRKNSKCNDTMTSVLIIISKLSKRTNSIDNNKANDCPDNKVINLILSSNLSNRNKKCDTKDSRILILLSKLLKCSNNDDNNNDVTFDYTSVLPLLLNRININLHESSINDNANALTLQVLLNHIKKKEKCVLLCQNNLGEEERQLFVEKGN